MLKIEVGPEKQIMSGGLQPLMLSTLRGPRLCLGLNWTWLFPTLRRGCINLYRLLRRWNVTLHWCYRPE